MSLRSSSQQPLVKYVKCDNTIITRKFTSKANTTCKITMKKHKLEQVNQIMYLGIVFDDKLTWKRHIPRVCPKLSGGLWALLKLRN